MSRVYKSSSVLIDENNRVTIDIAREGDFLIEDEILPDSQENDEIKEELSKEEIAAKFLENAEKKADSILENANLTALNIIDSTKLQAEADAGKIREQARNEGFKEGYEAGIGEADEIKAEANQIKEDAYTFKEELLKQAEPEIVELITKLLRKLLTDEVNINHDVITILVKQGLMQATLTGDIRVHISKFDYETVISNSDEIISSFETMAKIEFYEDISLKKSDCIIETNFGMIDCSLDEQCKTLTSNLYYLLKNR